MRLYPSCCGRLVSPGRAQVGAAPLVGARLVFLNIVPTLLRGNALPGRSRVQYRRNRWSMPWRVATQIPIP